MTGQIGTAKRGPPFSATLEVELERIVSLAEAAKLTGVSLDTLKRHYGHQILVLSPRRRGMKLRNALSIVNP
jgi:hypothetical protein